MSPVRLRIEPPAGAPTERECSNGTLTFGRGADCDVVITDPAGLESAAEAAVS